VNALELLGLQLNTSSQIALIEIVGSIESSDDIIGQIHRYRDQLNIGGIVVRIDSPGGLVAPTQEIYEELQKLDKPVVASMGGVAASGGYYIACGADKIVANPGSLTGSIGVIFQLPTAEKLLKKVGIGMEVVKSGKYKDTGSITRKISEDERQLLQRTIDDVYNQFIDAIHKGRKDKNLTKKELESIADGRILSGKQAFEMKLVDQLGNLQDAIDLAAKLGGIEGKPKIVKERRRKPFIERVLGKTSLYPIEETLRTLPSLRYELKF
jgi:protease-4